MQQLLCSSMIALRLHGSTVRAASCLALLLVALSQLLFDARAVSQAPVQLLVIAHSDVADARLDADALRAVFLRKRTWWENKQAIIPLNYPAGHPLRVAFDRSVLGLTGAEAARYWIDERIRYGTEAPMSIGSPALLARVVRQLPGSVGYIEAAAVPAGVKLLARVDGSRVLPP